MHLVHNVIAIATHHTCNKRTASTDLVLELLQLALLAGARGVIQTLLHIPHRCMYACMLALPPALPSLAAVVCNVRLA